MLAAAFAGKAAYLVTNDRDLLDLPAEVTGRFPFEILTPLTLLHRLGLEGAQ
jgi:predicted nucleic acid-binding protein